MLKEALAQLVEGKSLSQKEIEALFELLFSGEATPAQVGGLIVALRMKGETSEEIAGAALAMRKKATPIRIPEGRVAVDTCGTGGDGQHTLNVSTAAALVAAGAGVSIAKHGNKSVSSKCGSADVLEALGVNVQASVSQVEACVEEVGIGFLFAPALHGVMKHVIGPRRELGIRSMFNVLGPLSNPAGVKRQVLGVYSRELVPVIAQTLLSLGSENSLVVHGEEGLDEISPSTYTQACWVQEGKIKVLRLTPEDVGLARVPLSEIAGGDPEENARRITQLLEGHKDGFRTAVLLNAGAAIWMSGLAADWKEGVQKAERAIDKGEALSKLKRLCEVSHAPEKGS